MDFCEYFPVFSKLTSTQQSRIQASCRRRTAKAGENLHDGGPECKGLILLRSGQLRAYILSDEGREVTISRFFERDICLFSASCVMPNMQSDIVITAEKDSELWIIPAGVYKGLMAESLPLALYANDLIAGHFSELVFLMEQIMWKKFDARLAQFLLAESRLEGSHMLAITHDKIAGHMGTAREVVTRMLRYFQSEGMVRLTRGIVEIADEKALRKLAEE